MGKADWWGTRSHSELSEQVTNVETVVLKLVIPNMEVHELKQPAVLCHLQTTVVINDNCGLLGYDTVVCPVTWVHIMWMLSFRRNVTYRGSKFLQNTGTYLAEHSITPQKTVSLIFDHHNFQTQLTITLSGNTNTCVSISLGSNVRQMDRLSDSTGSKWQHSGLLWCSGHYGLQIGAQVHVQVQGSQE
jgi:hypothetical protein